MLAGWAFEVWAAESWTERLLGHDSDARHAQVGAALAAYGLATLAKRRSRPIAASETYNQCYGCSHNSASLPTAPLT